MTLDATLSSILAATAEAGRRPFRDTPHLAARGSMEQRARVGSEQMHAIEDHAVTVGPRTVRLRTYVPVPDPTGVVVHLHGGGWVLGSIETADVVARRLAAGTRARVVSVDYSLAPEHPYPAAVEDCVAAVRHVAAAHPGASLVIAGESAGGNLAITAARLLAAEVAPAALLAWYPPTDGTRRHGDGEAEVPGDEVLPLVDGPDLDWFWGQYCPDGDRRAEPDASPLLAEDLATLPPTVLVLAGHDPAHDEAAALGRALQEVGVPVRVLDEPALCHGFVSFADAVPAVDESLASVVALLSEFLAGS